MKASTQWLLGGLVFTATLWVIASALAFWWAAYQFQKPGPVTEPLLVEIESGSGLNDIAATLREKNAIENPYIFIFGTMILGAQSQMKAGEYEILPAASARDIMNLIRSGKVFARRITIREGLTTFEVINMVNTVDDLEGAINNYPPEGTLLPETYDYRLNETKQEIVQRMQKAMTDTIDELWEGRAQNLPFNTKEEAITLASIVEKETGVSSERQRVAGVFINRLRQGIALQTDPTVIYALTNGRPQNDGKGPLGRRLLSKDLDFESPYNTYLHAGLPPGPISNPGRAAIEAVLHPEEHSYIYFVADGSGGHIFASSLAEHNKNVSEWRKIRKEQNSKDN